MTTKAVVDFTDLRVGDEVKLEERVAGLDPGTHGTVIELNGDPVDEAVIQFDGQGTTHTFSQGGQVKLEAVTTLFRTTDRPVEPSGLAAANPTDTTIDLSWTDNSDDEEGFTVQYREADNDWDAGYDEIELDPDTEAHTVPDLTPETLYFFRVAAFIGTEEAYSNEVSESTTA